MDVKIMPDKASMGKAAAAAGAEHIRRVLAERGRANIIVATAPQQFGDARRPGLRTRYPTGNPRHRFSPGRICRAANFHPASFRGYLWQRFVSKLPLPPRAFHFLDGEGDPKAECQRVAEIIRRHPIDVAFVGIGENGHLAFNDPPADFETEEPYLVVQLDDACRRRAQLGEGWFPTFDDVPVQAYPR